MKTYISPRSPEEVSSRLAQALGLGLPKLPMDLWVPTSLMLPLPYRPIEENEFRFLLDAVRRLRRTRGRRSNGSTRTVRAKALMDRRLLTASDIRRAKFESGRLGMMAREDGVVVSARKSLLGGRILSGHEADCLLHSSAVEWLPALYFELNGIPIGGHETRICQRDGAHLPSWDDETVIRITAGSNTWDYSYAELQRAHRCRAVHEVDTTHDGVNPTKQQAIPGSLLFELGTASMAIARSYSWPAHRAFWFLLTDEVPQVEPVQVSIASMYGSRGTFASVTMVIEPWVSASVVGRMYGDAQLKYFKRTASKCPELASFALHDFVMDQRAIAPSPPSWPDIEDAWKRERTTSKRPSDRSSFQRTFRRTRDWLISEIWFPAYKMFAPSRPKREPRPRSKRK